MCTTPEIRFRKSGGKNSSSQRVPVLKAMAAAPNSPASRLRVSRCTQMAAAAGPGQRNAP